MPELTQIPDAMTQAFELVGADPNVKIIEPLHACENGEAEFRCAVRVDPFPNDEGLPEWARLRVRMLATFPYHEVEVFTEDEEVRGFPHQDAETNKLCLFPERMAPWDATRLQKYLDWTREWLSDAAVGKLLPTGHPFELPDFSRRDIRKLLPTKLPLLFDESTESFRLWQNRIGQSGVVELAPAESLRGLLTKEFCGPDGKRIREWEYPKALIDPKKRIWGRWVLLPTLIYQRHRPPQTFGELTAMCRDCGVHLLSVAREAWEEKNIDPELAFILFGSPVPRKVGDEPSEVHWQPMFFAGFRTIHRERREKEKHANYKAGTLWSCLLNEQAFGGGTQIPWGKSDNISRERMYARGGHRAIAKHNHIVLAGCGALGGIIAEMIARGGAPKMSLFDKDTFELGNQCRHTLDGRAVGEFKAELLARRLQSCNTLSVIEGFGMTLPPIGKPDTQTKFKETIEAADLLIDCTTDEGGFRWLDQLSIRTHQRLVSLFVNFRATVLTLCVSGSATPCGRVCDLLYQDIADGVTPVTQEEHGGQPSSDELVFPGAGCWHPTFPASNADLWMLAAAAVKSLDQILAKPIKKYGVGVLLRRNEKTLWRLQPSVETVWVRKYR